MSFKVARLNQIGLFFSTIGARTSAVCPAIDPAHPLHAAFNGVSDGDERSSIHYIDLLSLLGHCRGIKTSYKGALSCTPSKVITSSIEALVIPVAYIFNLSLKLGIFPSHFKISLATPLYKGKGRKDDPSNFHPISITPFLVKLFEKCILSQITEFLDSVEFFSPHQHGFRPALSTDTALLDIVQFIRFGLSCH